MTEMRYPLVFSARTFSTHTLTTAFLKLYEEGALQFIVRTLQTDTALSDFPVVAKALKVLSC
jgi:hypothetical protein